MLRAEEREPLVQLAVLLVGDQVDGADRLEALIQLGQALAHAGEVARGVVAGQQRRGVDAVRAIGLLGQLLAAHASLGRLQLDVVDGGDQPVERALLGTRVLLDRPQLLGQPLVSLAGLARLVLATVALDGHLAGGGIRAPALAGQPGAALVELRAALAPLLDARGEVGVHLVQPDQLAPQRLGALGGAGQLHARGGEPRHQRRLRLLGRLDRRP